MKQEGSGFHLADSQDPGSPWDEDPVHGPRSVEEASCGSHSGRSLRKNGERRGSRGASRPALVTESRESLQSDRSLKKPLRDALTFDLTQPWQRSLLRDLEQIENQMKEEGDTRPRPHADRILLGHAESGDFMLECEDDISTCTDASSTCPTRLQVVHRHQLPMRSRSKSRNESPSREPTKFFDIRNTSPNCVQAEAGLTIERSMPNAPSIPYLAHPNAVTESGEEFRPIPHTLPRNRSLSCTPVTAELFRTNAFSEEASPSQASRVLTDEDQDFIDPACMCMGYESLIDLIMFNEPTVRKKKRRTSVWESPSLNRRSSMTSLNRVQEEDDEDIVDFDGLNPFYRSKQTGSINQSNDLQLYDDQHF